MDPISQFYFKKKKDDNTEIQKCDKNVNFKQKLDFCAICYEDRPNILFDPCNHCSICKTCLINNIKYNDS